MRFVIGIILIGFFAACSSTGPLSGGVRVTSDPKDVAACRLLGSITSVGGRGDLKRQARELGGNVVYLVSESVSVGTGANETTGMVYLCGSPSREK